MVRNGSLSRAALPLAVLATLATAACGDDAGGGTTSTPSGATFSPRDLITDARYGGMLVEIDWVVGRRPDDGVIGRLDDTVAGLVDGGYLGKPDGVRYVLDDEIPASGDPGRVYTFEELDALVAAHRDMEPAANEAGVYILFVDGAYEEDEGSGLVLGFAYGGSAIVMLADNVARACDTPLPLLQERLCEMTTATVMVHELGHLFGLVDNGTPMVVDHKDDEHGAHDSNEDCIMYWQVGRSAAAGLMMDRINGGMDSLLPFDRNCLDDLEAAQTR